MIQQKDESIETLRAVAIILVLGIHITADPAISEVTAFYSYLALAFDSIRMPLFTVISGYLYAHRKAIKGHFFSFFQGKIRRLLIPLLFVSALEFLSKSILPGVNNPTNYQEVWRVLVYPYEHYWFIQAILIIFIVVGYIDIKGGLNSYKNWIAFFLLSIAFYLLYPKLPFSVSLFSIGRTSYLLPFFLLGYGLVMYPSKLCSNRCATISLLLFFIGYAIQNYLWFSQDLSPHAQRSLLGLIMALTGPLLLVRYRTSIWGLKFIGGYAFTIYLYQGFGLSLGRRIVEFIPFGGPHFYFLFVVGCAIAFGIGVTLAFSRVPILKTLMLGIK